MKFLKQVVYPDNIEVLFIYLFIIHFNHISLFSLPPLLLKLLFIFSVSISIFILRFKIIIGSNRV